MPEPDLNLLFALNVLLKEESVAGAARHLGLSASAMSRTLSRLRDSTGDPLLVRAGRKMVLTPHAVAIRERARHTASEARAVLSSASSSLNLVTLERDFTLRTNEGFVTCFAPSLINAVAAVAPGVSLHFLLKPVKDSHSLREGEVDIEIGVEKNMGPEIYLQTLFKDRFIGVMRRDRAAGGESMTPEQYCRFQHVVTTRHAQRTGPVDHALAEQGLKRNIAAVVPDFSSALAVAEASSLIALVPVSSYWHYSLHHDVNLLYAFELPVRTSEITISQMWHPRLNNDLAHQWLRNLIMEICREGIDRLKKLAEENNV